MPIKNVFIKTFTKTGQDAANNITKHFPVVTQKIIRVTAFQVTRGSRDFSPPVQGFIGLVTSEEVC
jgi:hypothetical protein